MLFCCVWTLSLALSCVLGIEVDLKIAGDCVIGNGDLTFIAVYNGTGVVNIVEWYYSRRISSSLLIVASTCTSFGIPDSGYPPTSRMIYKCPSNGLAANTFQLIVKSATEQEINSTWGAGFRIVSAPATTVEKIVASPCACVCISCRCLKILCWIAIALSLVFIIITIIMIIKVICRRRRRLCVFQNLDKCVIAVLISDIVVFLYSLIVGIIAVATNYGCRKCPFPICNIKECDECLDLGIASIALAIILIAVAVILYIIWQARVYMVMVYNKSGNTPDTAYIILTGKCRSYGKKFLKEGETKTTDKYEIRMCFLGQLQKCKVGYDGNETTWNLEKITIRDEDDSVYDFASPRNILPGPNNEVELTLKKGTEMYRGIPDGRSTANAGKHEEVKQSQAPVRESFEMEDSKPSSDKTKTKLRPQPPLPGINPDRHVPPITSTSDKTDKDKKTRGLSSNFDDKQQNMPNDQHQNKLDSLPPADKPKTLLKPLGTENKTDTDDDENTEHDTMSGEKKRKKKKKKKSDD